MELNDFGSMEALKIKKINVEDKLRNSKLLFLFEIDFEPKYPNREV
jgi:hypothetical protein